MLRILHCADLHLDSPFKSGNAEKSEVRRKELRGTFSSLMMYIKTNRIDIALMAGDLFDSGFVTKDTADFFVKELAAAAPCRFVIAPGNHDPYTPDSVYAKTAFPDNVYIFHDTALNKFSFPELNTDVYGYAFVTGTLDYNPFAGRGPEDSSGINLLCAHADVGNPISVYCPVPQSDIAACGFDYCAFGHIHNSDGLRKAGNTYYAYSGCLEGRDFGETGHKGAIYAEITKERGLTSVKATGVRFSKRKYEVLTADMSGCSETEQLLTGIRNAVSGGKFGSDTLLRLVLTGNVSPKLVINTQELAETVGQGLFYMEIVDRTLPLYDIKALENDPSIRGAFFREIRPCLESGTPEERALAAKALRAGLSTLAGEDLP